MRTPALAIALLLAGTAVAQTATDTGTMETDVGVQADTTTDTDLTTTSDATLDTGVADGTMTHQTDMTATPSTTADMTMASVTPASGQVVQPGNDNPERDARGIAVVSDPAFVPAGWNGIAATAIGGPVEAADASYPACTATVTDNCLQTYERGRS